TDVSALGTGERLELLALARQLSDAAGLVSERCCGLQQRQSRGYHPYKGGLRLWDGEQLQALEQRSPLVQSLCQAQELAWLIHPAEVGTALRQELRLRLGEAESAG
ncbi:MAG: HD family phosphohydrolase, partial [Cyanobacteriota bacterium]|nr:HD family phosphohydrolase [Cyanobacteriota bacterium]